LTFASGNSAGFTVKLALLHRTGSEVSLGALITRTAAAMLLVGIDVLVFREKLDLSHGVGHRWLWR